MRAVRRTLGSLAIVVLGATAAARSARAEAFPVVNLQVTAGLVAAPELGGLLEPALEVGLRTPRLQTTLSAGARFNDAKPDGARVDFAWTASATLRLLRLVPSFTTNEDLFFRNERAIYLRAGARFAGGGERVGPWLGIGLSRGCTYAEFGYTIEMGEDEPSHQVLAVVGISANPYCYYEPAE